MNQLLPDADQIQQRIAVAEIEGYKQCTDFNCDYRRVNHLHKNGIVYFPESFSVPMYPDYLNDLQAMHAIEEILCASDAGYKYDMALLEIVKCFEDGPPNYKRIWHATARQKVEAALKAIGKNP